MSRWIDADALTEKLKQHHDFFVEAWNGFKNMPIKDKARCDELTNCMAEIFNAPSIDIVRCKECYMCDEEMWCSFYDSIMESDDFCSYGERRE